MTFGEKLLKLRKEKGLSQETLAEQIGTTRQAVSKWENNQGFPETEKLLQLSNIFETSVDFLLKDEKASHDANEKELKRELKKRINNALNNEVANAAKENMVEATQTTVYNAYDPAHYERRLENGG